MKKTLSILSFIFMGFLVQAQTPYAKNAVYLELLGNGGLYSLNYERAFSQKFLVRVGFASWSSSQDFGGEKSITTIPVMFNSLFGTGNHKIEGGAGFMLGSEKHSGNEVWPKSKETIFALTGVAGYRYQKSTGGLLFRAGLTPFLNIGDAEYPDFNISAGGSIGYAF